MVTETGGLHSAEEAATSALQATHRATRAVRLPSFDPAEMARIADRAVAEMRDRDNWARFAGHTGLVMIDARDAVASRHDAYGAIVVPGSGDPITPGMYRQLASHLNLAHAPAGSVAFVSSRDPDGLKVALSSSIGIVVLCDADSADLPATPAPEPVRDVSRPMSARAMPAAAAGQGAAAGASASGRSAGPVGLHQRVLSLLSRPARPFRHTLSSGEPGAGASRRTARHRARGSATQDRQAGASK